MDNPALLAPKPSNAMSFPSTRHSQLEPLESYEEILRIVNELAKNVDGLDQQRKQAFIDRKISEIIGIRDITAYRENPKNYRVYHGHLADLAGVVTNTPPTCEADASGQLSCRFTNGIDLSGWQPEEFLPLRISYLFWLTISLVNEEISKPRLPKFSYSSIDTPRTELVRRVAQEICVELHTYDVAFKVAKIAQDCQQQVDELLAEEDLEEMESVKENFRNCAQQMLEDILNLQLGEEVSYSSGSVDHCVYVSFMRTRVEGVGEDEDLLLIRVDNAGLWSEDTDWHPAENIAGNTAVHPSCIELYNFADFQNFLKLQSEIEDYLVDILFASLLPQDLAKAKIYKLSWQGQQDETRRDSLNFVSKKFFSSKIQQTVGNCVVASHDIGMRIRINYNSQDEQQQPYIWIKKQETRTSATPDPQIGVI